ncbi:MAG: TonB-dependent receptor domain-containing protein [Flavisolibacter sp.]
MKRIFSLAFFSMTLSIAFGQMPGGFQRNGQQGQMPNGRFYGKIVDASNKGIEAASVVLVTSKMDTTTKKPKEVIVGGMLTSGTGDFSVENVPLFGRYKLRVTGIGYKAVEKPVGFEMPNRNAMSSGDQSAMLNALDKDLGNIKLEVDNQVLGNVTVTASKPLLQLGVDRKIFNVEKNIVSAGGTAIDVMKNVPSVNVDIDGNVTLRNAAPQIFVDGRPTNLTLDQIPADAIESVEIITNPSAKFDASGGTAGILNIVMKKNKRVGYSGNLRLNVDSRAKLGFGGDINVRQNKINVFASANINQRKSLGEGTTTRNTLGGRPNNSLQKDNSTMNGVFGFGRLGFDYFIDNRNTLTVTQSFMKANMDPNSTSNIYTDTTSNGSYDNLQQRLTNSDNHFRNTSSQLSFKHNFPKAGHEWTVDATYNKGKNENNALITSNYFDLPTGLFNRTYDQEQLGSGDNKNLVLQTDYSNPLSSTSKLELGARASIRTVDNATNYFVIDGNGFKLPITAQNIVYASQDRVYAGYATFSNKFKNFGYQVGLRAESSTYQGELRNKGQKFNTNYPISLFPSVFLSQKINDNSDLQLNYSRRINRPGFWQMFPFVDISDSLNISHGNPALKPEFTNSIELSYSKTFKNRDNFLASVYFKNTNDLITRYLVPEYVQAYDSVMPVSTYINANRSYVTGLELIGKNKITKFWDLTSNLNLFTSKISLTNTPSPDQFISYFFKINNTIKLPKNFSLQISGDYQSKIVSSPGGTGGGSGGGGRGFGGGMGGMFGGGGMSAAQGYIRPYYGVDAAVRYEFLKEKRASVSLSINDILKTRKYDSHTESTFFIQDAQRWRDPQVVRLNFNWRFGKFDANLFKRKDTKAENNVNMDTGNF